MRRCCSSTCPRSVDRSSRLRDGSRLRCRPRVRAGRHQTALRGRPRFPIREADCRCRQRRLRNLSVPTNRSSKTASSTPLGLTAFGRRTPEESRPPRVGDDCREPRRLSSCALGRRAASVGPFQGVDDPVTGPGANPIGWGRACAAARRARSSLRSRSRSIAVAGGAPVRRVAPRAGPEFHVWGSDAVHLFSFGAVLVLCA